MIQNHLVHLFLSSKLIPKPSQQMFCKNRTCCLNGGQCQNGHAYHQLSSQRRNSPLTQGILSCCGDSSLQLKPFLGAEETLLCFCYCQILSDGGPRVMEAPIYPHLNHLELKPFGADCSNKTPLSKLPHILHWFPSQSHCNATHLSPQASSSPKA